jgi:hypothetical protein
MIDPELGAHRRYGIRSAGGFHARIRTEIVVQERHNSEWLITVVPRRSGPVALLYRTDSLQA